MHRIAICTSLTMVAALSGCGSAPENSRIAALEARVDKLEHGGSAVAAPKVPHTLLISWTDTPGTVTKSYPDAAACEAAKASLLEENRKTSESIPVGTTLATPPHLAKPTCMAG